jgi:hypothetical protein
MNAGESPSKSSVARGLLLGLWRHTTPDTRHVELCCGARSLTRCSTKTLRKYKRAA